MEQIRHYFGLHFRNCLDALAALRAQPLATAFTVAAIGIALALPATLNLLVRSGQAVASSWETARDFSVYLKPGTPRPQADALVVWLSKQSAVSEVELITDEEALRQFRETSGLGPALEHLGSNPLPHTLMVRPIEDTDEVVLKALETDLLQRPDVDQVHIDTEWVERLNAILDFLRRTVTLVALMLVAAVVIVVGNTIRLDIQNRRDEIEVLKLLGATNGFVRRPFLYLGLWYGVAGGVFALLLLLVALLLVRGPLQHLASLYGTTLNQPGLDLFTPLAVLLVGLLAGWGGAWSAVARHLADIEPE